MEENDAKDEPSMADAFMEMLDVMTSTLEATAGYRAKCEAQGFSETASEQMAMQFHAFLMANMVKGVFS